MPTRYGTIHAKHAVVQSGERGAAASERSGEGADVGSCIFAHRSHWGNRLRAPLPNAVALCSGIAALQKGRGVVRIAFSDAFKPAA